MSEDHRIDAWPDDSAGRRHAGSDAAPAGDLNASGLAHVGWTPLRKRLLSALALLGAAGWAFWVHLLVASPALEASWQETESGQIRLTHSRQAELQPHQGALLLGVTGAGSPFTPLDARVLARSPRWVIGDADRLQHQALQSGLADAFSKGAVTLTFSDGRSARVQPARLSLTGLPPVFWLLSLFALTLYFVAGMVVIVNPVAHNRLYALATWCQAANLLMIASESTGALGMATPFAAIGMPLHMALDLVTGVAIAFATCLHPRRLPGAPAIAAVSACAAMALWLAGLRCSLPHVWWWNQAATAVFCVGVTGLLSGSYRVEPHPFVLVMRRFALLTHSTWLLLTSALAFADGRSGIAHEAAYVGAMVWYVFFGSMLLLVPFFAQTRSALREFPLLTAACSVTLSLALLFTSQSSLSPFGAWTLSVFVSLALYSGARRWVLEPLLGSSRLTSERTLEQLYRITRELQAQPQRAPILLSRLVGELFQPLEVSVVGYRLARTRVASDGSRMLVPMPPLGSDAGPGSSVMMRFAQRGTRLFSAEDARLSDRIVEQIRRAVNFDRAVEQGRSEERMRLAQDLHDDIGARLLTLMYTASSPETEEYARHTLQDLKTLTRGLAASNHRLSHAAAEWKSDLMHRLTAAQVELNWSFMYDEDILLTVVHWSALTRILRELVSNAIAHSGAQRLAVEFRLYDDQVDLTVTDDGTGVAPAAWSHGLGLGGVRKRVKQLGGTVEWSEATPRGIVCRVTIRELSAQG